MLSFRKVLILAAIFMLILCMIPLGNNHVFAKTEKQNQYDKFKKLKMNSSPTDVAKIIYGKNYKDDLCEYDKNVYALCYDRLQEEDKYYKNGKLRYYNHVLEFFPHFDLDNDDFKFRMRLRFKSKDGSKTLKLVEKRWEDYDVLNTHNVYNNKRIKEGMTTKQIDAITTGKGIGPYDSVFYGDYSKVGYQEGSKSPVFYDQYKLYSYTMMNQRLDVLYNFIMEYNYKIKSYEAVYVYRYG